MTDFQGDSSDHGELAPAGNRRRGDTRAALLSAAERMWAERGIHGASLDDIAAVAGLTKGAVYSNFTGKIDMLFALLERYAEERVETTVGRHLHGRGHSLDDRLDRAGEEHEQRLATEETRLLALLSVEFWLYGMRDYAAGWRVAEWQHLRRCRLAERLTDAGGISAIDRATLAMAVGYGLMLQQLLDPDRVPAGLYASGMRLVLGPAAS